ncbi:MAG: hypothetical protein Q7R76_03220 [Candidatus Woesearchaeota archaeon]|nr:hypothetical protein [Candidatus Woesearchaeota archaeon]
MAKKNTANTNTNEINAIDDIVRRPSMELCLRYQTRIQSLMKDEINQHRYVGQSQRKPSLDYYDNRTDEDERQL